MFVAVCICLLLNECALTINLDTTRCRDKLLLLLFSIRIYKCTQYICDEREEENKQRAQYTRKINLNNKIYNVNCIKLRAQPNTATFILI